MKERNHESWCMQRFSSGVPPNTEAAREVAGTPSEAAARRSMAFSSGNTARAALIASELCELCAHLSVHLNDLRIHLSHLSVRLSVHLSDVSDLCLELLHRQHWLNWGHRSCGQRRHNLMNYCSWQLACCGGGGRLAYAGIRSCHRVDFGRPICPGVGAVAYSA